MHIYVVWLQARGYKNIGEEKRPGSKNTDNEEKRTVGWPAYLWAGLNSADLERGIAPRSDIKNGFKSWLAIVNS